MCQPIPKPFSLRISFALQGRRSGAEWIGGFVDWRTRAVWEFWSLGVGELFPGWSNAVWELESLRV